MILFVANDSFADNTSRPLSDDDKSHLFSAARTGNLDVIKRYLDSGGDINVRQGDQTLLIYALEPGFSHTAVVRLLVDHGADLFATTSGTFSGGWTALHYAAKFEDVESANILMSAADRQGRLSEYLAMRTSSSGKTAAEVAKGLFGGAGRKDIIAAFADFKLTRNTTPTSTAGELANDTKPPNAASPVANVSSDTPSELQPAPDVNKQKSDYDAYIRNIQTQNANIRAAHRAGKDLNIMEFPLPPGVAAAEDAPSVSVTPPQAAPPAKPNKVIPTARDDSSTRAACENTFTINGLKGMYSAADFSGERVVKATGEKSKESTSEIFAIILHSNERIEGVERYQAVLILPGSRAQVGSVPVQDDQSIPGLELGAVAKLIYSIGVAKNGVTVSDAFLSNRDYGRNRVAGEITIEAMSPKIMGRFKFDAYGDGYPSLNDFQAKVTDGRFCVDP